MVAGFLPNVTEGNWQKGRADGERGGWWRWANRCWGVGEGKESHQKLTQLPFCCVGGAELPTNMVTKTFCAVLCISWPGGCVDTTTTPHHRSSAGQNSMPVVFCDIWPRNSLQLMTASWRSPWLWSNVERYSGGELQNLIRKYCKSNEKQS